MSAHAPTPTQTSPAVCPLDCPDTCSLQIEHTATEIVAVKGSSANPFTAGRICKKVAKFYPEFLHGEHRLRYPMRRTGPKGSKTFQRISWEEALDEVHAGIQKTIDRHGPQSVVPFNYAGPHGLLADGSMDRRFFHRLGASLVDRGPLCGGIRALAHSSLFGSMPGMGPEQAEHANLLIVWSNNVTVSNLHLTRVIDKARRRGAKVVVIDPKRIQVADRADMFLQPRPGTDVVLAFALCNELERLGAVDDEFVTAWTLGYDAFMEEARRYPVDTAAQICGVDAQDIRTMAKWFADSSPVAMSVGNGMERSKTGGASIRAAMALSAIGGKFGVEGGGVIAKPGNAFPKTSDKLQCTHWIPEGTRTVNILDVSKHILAQDIAPPIRAVVIYNHNPVATHPDQVRMREALSHPDLFTVGIEIANTDSMAYCDVVLPACGPFEIDDIYGAYGQQYLQRAAPVIAPVDEALPNTEIFRRLAAKFGFDEPEFQTDDRALMDDALDVHHPSLNGVRPSELPLGTSMQMRIDGDPIVAFKNVFPSTPSGKIELYSQDLEHRFGAGVPRYQTISSRFPLQLITPSSDDRTNATFGGVKASQKVEDIEIHPIDADARGIKDGDLVSVHNDLGTTELIARISEGTRPGVAYSAKGMWLASSSTDQTVNSLVIDIRSDIADGACFNDTYVEISGADS